MRSAAQTHRLFPVLALGLAALAWPSAREAAAQSWPSRNIKLVTPQPAGTAIDTGLRLFADRLAKKWGHGVIVENRPGGDGIPATSAFVQTRDDHALYASPGYPFTIAPSMLDKLPYDPQADVTPISLMFETPLAIATNAKLPASSLAELEKLAKASPGKLNWASTAGLPNFAFNYFLKTTSADMAYVPYRDAASALNDVGEGRIEVYVTSYGTILPVLQAGKLKVLAMLGGTRIPLAPHVPTTAETGYPKVRADGFAGLFGMKGMPSTQRDRIADDVRAVAGEAEVAALMAKSAMVPRGLPPSEFQKILDGQRALVGEMISALGIARKTAP
jgi:tripartite-type tricarboxylate transporter receptor subunit TctC